MNPSFGFPGPKAVELPERRSFVEDCREELVLFTRRRMLDWKSQLTRAAVILGGSALVFAAWKSVIGWLA
jgi:hypothetical protein